MHNAHDNAPNPKKAFGDKKPPLAQLPLIARVAASAAHYDGDLKYGFRNWRDQPVEAMTYINAIERHAALWAEGEEFARDTGVNNLGAVIACCAILLDAQLNDALIDNRSPSPAACDYLHNAEDLITRIRKNAQRRAADREAIMGRATSPILPDAINGLPKDPDTPTAAEIAVATFKAATARPATN